MGRLQEVVQEYLETGSEVHDEGVNIVEYWFARCNIDKDEFMDTMVHFVNGTLTAPGFRELSPGSRSLAVLTQGFLLGMLYGRTKADDEF